MPTNPPAKTWSLPRPKATSTLEATVTVLAAMEVDTAAATAVAAMAAAAMVEAATVEAAMADTEDTAATAAAMVIWNLQLLFFFKNLRNLHF